MDSEPRQIVDIEGKSLVNSLAPSEPVPTVMEERSPLPSVVITHNVDCLDNLQDTQQLSNSSVTLSYGDVVH